MYMEILIKLLILLISEYKESGKIISGSLAKKILEEINIENKPKVYSDDTELIVNLKEMIEKIVDGKLEPNEELLLSIELLLAEKPHLLNIINKYVNKKNQKRIISNLLIELNSQLKKISSKRLLQTALAKVASNNTDTDMIIETLIDKLEDIKSMKDIVNPAVVDKINFSDPESIRAAANRASQLVSEGQALKTGWKCINAMTQGGLRRGELVTASALPHNYKSSFTKSLFMQIARLNKPVADNPEKTPMLLFISLEEEIDNIMSFFYLYLKHSIDNKTFSKKEQKNLDNNDIREYITQHLSKVSGYHIEVLRYRPEFLTYSALFNIVNEYEKKGFELHGVFVDYVKKMNRAGCNNSGPMGTDLLDLFSRIRNEFSSKKILFFTPHQLNTSSKQLLRNGMPPIEFVKFLPGKGFYADSSQLDQEIDLELFLHIVKINKKSYLAVARGKHRIPTIIPEEDKFTLLEFSDSISPIREDSDDYSPCCKEAKTDNEFIF